MRLLELTATLALALACAWPLAFNLVDPDLWGHVRYGQDWIAAGELPRTATHTYTAVGHPWINHENLFELAIAACYDTFGVGGMLIAKCLLGMTIIAAMVWIAGKRGVHPLVAWTLMLVVTTNLQPFFPLRPQLFSFACCAAALVLLDRGFRDWHVQRVVDARCLWCLPLVLAVWTNSHGGFVAGLCIVGAYLGGRIVELLLPRKNIALVDGGSTHAHRRGLRRGDVRKSLRLATCTIGSRCRSSSPDPKSPNGSPRIPAIPYSGLG